MPKSASIVLPTELLLLLMPPIPDDQYPFSGWPAKLSVTDSWPVSENRSVF